MQNIRLSLDVTNQSRDHNMDIELWLDDIKFFDNTVSPGKHHVMHEFPDGEAEHVLKFILKNKQEHHTKINDNGVVVEDSLINIGNITIDEIVIDQLVYNLAEYLHDGNGSKATESHPFYGNLGCNGEVKLNFSTPIYLWLLENM